MILFCALAAHGQTQLPNSVDAGKTAPTGRVLRIGGGVTPPRVTYQLRPEYPEEARAAGLEGTCVLWLVVGADGKTRRCQGRKIYPETVRFRLIRAD